MMMMTQRLLWCLLLPVTQTLAALSNRECLTILDHSDRNQDDLISKDEFSLFIYTFTSGKYGGETFEELPKAIQKTFEEKIAPAGSLDIYELHLESNMPWEKYFDKVCEETNWAIQLSSYVTVYSAFQISSPIDLGLSPSVAVRDQINIAFTSFVRELFLDNAFGPNDPHEGTITLQETPGIYHVTREGACENNPSSTCYSIFTRYNVNVPGPNPIAAGPSHELQESVHEKYQSQTQASIDSGLLQEQFSTSQLNVIGAKEPFRMGFSLAQFNV